MGFKFREKGHVGSQCKKPRKEQPRGKVFAALVASDDEGEFTIGTCFISSILLVTFIDAGAI